MHDMIYAQVIDPHILLQTSMSMLLVGIYYAQVKYSTST